MGGTGFMGEHEGTGFGHQGFHYWDDKALVNQTLHFLDGKQIEIMERLSIWDDKTQLSCTVELHTEDAPFASPKNSSIES
jgi:hypothetical protein